MCNNTYNIFGRCFLKSLSSREILKILREHGWQEKGPQEGSHLFMIHPKHPELGKVTIPHPRKSFLIKTMRSIEKQTGVKF